MIMWQALKGRNNYFAPSGLARYLMSQHPGRYPGLKYLAPSGLWLYLFFKGHSDCFTVWREIMRFMLATLLLLFFIPPVQEVSLRAGREASVAGLKIRFESVADDSRCPQGVTCVWAGNAEVVLKVKAAKGETATIKLNTNINPKEASYQGYLIKLARLTPYPKKDEKIEPDHYEVVLVVSKK
jgi:hypothetical protein